MKNLKEKLTAFSFMLSIPFLSMFYGVLNKGGIGAYSLVTDIDRGIPFLKIFILPYTAWYFFIFAVFCYLCIKDRKLYYRTLIAYNISIVICYIIYFFYQTTVPRPILTGDDILTRMVALVYRNDNPYNCFPSIHSLTSYLMLKAISVSSIRNRANLLIIGSMSVSIILSTFFVKQHVILDAISAILLGDMIFRLANNLDKERVLLCIRRLFLLPMMKKKLEI